MAIEKVEKDRCHEQPPEHHGRAHAELSARRGMRAGRRGLGLFDLAQDPLAVGKEAGAGLRQPHAARRAAQQVRTDPLLERRHSARDRRRRHRQPARRGREALFFGDGDEDPHGIQAIHLIIS